MIRSCTHFQWRSISGGRSASTKTQAVLFFGVISGFDICEHWSVSQSADRTLWGCTAWSDLYVMYKASWWWLMGICALRWGATGFCWECGRARSNLQHNFEQSYLSTSNNQSSWEKASREYRAIHCNNVIIGVHWPLESSTLDRFPQHCIPLRT